MEPSRKKQKKEHGRPATSSRRTRANKSPTPEPENDGTTSRRLPMPSLDPLLRSGSLISSLTDKTLEEMESFFTTTNKKKNVPAAVGTAVPSKTVATSASGTSASTSGATKSTTIKTSTYVPKFGPSTNVMQLIQEKFKMNFPEPLKLNGDEKDKAPSGGEKTEEAEKVDDINADCPLFQLPTELVSHIFEEYMTYDEVSKVRGVSRWFRNTCGEHLNRAFSRLQSKMQGRFQAIKSQMPRRESARRKHPLARECDIIETVHMRLTLLQMTFGRHIDRRHCCFFPGAIIDEVYRILDYIKTTSNLGRAYKVTDELFDLSTMAMEYFKDKVEPTLPEVNYFTTEFPDLTNTFKSSLTGVAPILRTPTDKPIQPPKAPSTAPPGNHGNQDKEDKQSQLKRQLRNQQLEMLRVKRDLTRHRGRTVRLEKQNGDFNLRLLHFEKKDDERERKLNVALEELRKCQTELCSVKQIVQSRVSPPIVEN